MALSSVLIMSSVLPAGAADVAKLAGGGASATLAATTTAFSDVSLDNANAEAVLYLKSKGVVQGYADGSFGVDKNINRAEFLKILLLASGTYTEDAGKACLAKLPAAVSKFKDVDTSAWYAPYMCVAIRDGIMAGYPDGTMHPDSAINVPEMAKIVSLVMKLPLGDAGSNWYDTYVKALEAKSALPTSLGTLSANVTRGEMAEVVFRTKENRADKASMTESELLGQPRARLASGTVGKIASCSELSRVMDDQMSQDTARGVEGIINDAVPPAGSNMNANGGSTGGMGAMPVTAPSKEGLMDGQTAPTTGGGSDSYSSTNVQVEGVDEGDIVKNDGRYIYTTKNNEVRIVDTQSMKEIGRVKTTDANFWPSELYVNGNRLVIVGSTYEDSYNMPMPASSLKMSIMPIYFSRTLTKTILVDITDRSAPKVDRTVTMEGYANQTRRIGDKLYVILNDYPRYWLMREQFAPVESILPTVQDSARGTEEKSAVNCNDVEYFPGFQQPNYMTVAVIPTSDTSKDVQAKVFLGNAETVYMSENALYVTTGAASDKDTYWDWNNTQVYKFGLTDTGVEQSATARVKGRVLNQFSMDEHNGNLRMATHNDNWDSTTGTNNSDNAVYVLDAGLKIIGSVLNIAPGENIEAVRFMGDRGYVVTFKNIDPFFALDLSVPTAPKLLGALKIPGWSTYLHPYDATHIIGFGQDVQTQTGASMGADQPVTWQNVRGMKMSMFDVSDVANPKEQFTTTLGVEGTYSELLYNHKALLFDKDKNLLAFPITLTEPNGVKIYKTCSLDASNQEVCEETSRYNDYKPVFDGAIVFTVDLVNGFKERGRISHFDKGYLDYTQPNLPENEYQKTISRIIYIGDKLYTISQAMVKQADINTVQVTATANLAD